MSGLTEPYRSTTTLSAPWPAMPVDRRHRPGPQGATLVGWLIDLIWSMNAIHPSRGPVVNGGKSCLNLSPIVPRLSLATGDFGRQGRRCRERHNIEALAGGLERLAQSDQSECRTSDAN